MLACWPVRKVILLALFSSPLCSSLFVVISSSHQTNNSLSVALFSQPLLVPVSTGAEASASSTVVSMETPTSSSAAPSLPTANLPHPPFSVAVVNAVEVALATMPVSFRCFGGCSFPT